MDAVLLLARLALASVFGLAGVAKLVDRAGTIASLRGFGVPLAMAGPMALLLPAAELVCAAGLIPAQSASVAAMGVLALLLLFMGAIGINLLRGRKPDCHCFGQLHSAPIGPATLIRNVGLAAVAVFILRQQPAANAAGPTLGGSSGNPTMLVLLCVVSAVLSAAALLMVFQLLRQNGRILMRLDAMESQLGIAPARAPEGLPVGSPAPPFTLQDLDGRPVTLDMLQEGRKGTLLVFSEPGCGACETLLPEVARWQHDESDHVVTVLVSRGSIEANRTKSSGLNPSLVLLQKDREVAEQYRVVGTPSAVLVEDGIIASPLASGGENIAALVAEAMVPRLRPGDPAPNIELPDLAGHQVSLDGRRDRPTLLLFWNPTCGYCQQMLPDIKAWESAGASQGPGLVVISAGSIDLVEEQGFRSPVLLDEDFRAGQAFGVSGTPSAVMLDREGKVASALAVGQAPILALLRTAAA